MFVPLVVMKGKHCSKCFLGPQALSSLHEAKGIRSMLPPILNIFRSGGVKKKLLGLFIENWKNLILIIL
jgi:hypothetical protein